MQTLGRGKKENIQEEQQKYPESTGWQHVGLHRPSERSQLCPNSTGKPVRDWKFADRKVWKRQHWL
jgi:hypothetical protein